MKTRFPKTLVIASALLASVVFASGCQTTKPSQSDMIMQTSGEFPSTYATIMDASDEASSDEPSRIATWRSQARRIDLLGCSPFG